MILKCSRQPNCVSTFSGPLRGRDKSEEARNFTRKRFPLSFSNSELNCVGAKFRRKVFSPEEERNNRDSWRRRQRGTHNGNSRSNRKMTVSRHHRTSPKPKEFSISPVEAHMAGVLHSPNGFLGNGTVSPQPVIVVRAEEALIVVLVLALWIAAIALFFNRWGKIRMLEPYQPKFIQQHRPSCPLVDQVQHRSFSKFNISNDVFQNHQKSLRPRQNSVFVGSSMMNLPLNTPRKVKSAFDLQNLVFSDPALNKSSVRINSGGDYFRRSSLLPVYPRKSVGEGGQCDNPQHSGERRLSFKDLVEIERAQVQRSERVQCHMEKEPPDVELPRKNKKIGETKQKSTFSNQSSLSDSRHNSITTQDLKTMCANKVSNHERRNSSFPAQRELSPNFDCNELRPEGKSGVNNFRRNSMLIINSLENERNFLNPRESIKSGVLDFRRNSMLIINNLTEDIGYRSIGRNHSLGGSNIALGADLPFRRNSVIPPYSHEPKKLTPAHAPSPKPKSPKSPFTETKHLCTHKSSKSLDCGDGARVPNWRSKKEASQPSLVSEGKQQFLTPMVPQVFAGSSASLNADCGRRESRLAEESRSTGDLNREKSDFGQPRIIEIICCSPNANENKINLADSGECIRNGSSDGPSSITVEERNSLGKDDQKNKGSSDMSLGDTISINVVTVNDGV